MSDKQQPTAADRLKTAEALIKEISVVIFKDYEYWQRSESALDIEELRDKLREQGYD